MMAEAFLCIVMSFSSDRLQEFKGEKIKQTSSITSSSLSLSIVDL